MADRTGQDHSNACLTASHGRRPRPAFQERAVTPRSGSLLRSYALMKLASSIARLERLQQSRCRTSRRQSCFERQPSPPKTGSGPFFSGAASHFVVWNVPRGAAAPATSPEHRARVRRRMIGSGLPLSSFSIALYRSADVWKRFADPARGSGKLRIDFLRDSGLDRPRRRRRLGHAPLQFGNGTGRPLRTATCDEHVVEDEPDG